jgi:hypothetical protein
LPGPISASPPIRQFQTGAIRQIFFPVFDADGDATSCRIGTDAEAGFTGSVPTIAGNAPVITAVPGGCLVTWNVAGSASISRSRSSGGTSWSTALSSSSRTRVKNVPRTLNDGMP